MAYTQDQFGMWYDSADQANAANQTFANQFVRDYKTPEQVAALYTGNGSGQITPSAPSGGAISSAPMGGGGGGGGGLGFGGGGGMGGQNPYLQPMMDSITNQVTTNFNRNVMPRIASSNLATGGYGGSRRGVVEANAMNDLNQGLSNSLANLGLQDFNAMRGYDLGLRGNDFQYAGLDAQINQNNFNNQLAGAQFGQNVWNQGMANNQAGINAGTNIQNTPMNYWSQFGNQYNSVGQGFGSTTGSTSQQGNPFMGALGGAQVGSRLGNMWGGGVGGSAGSTQDWTYGGSGTNRGPSDNIDWIYG